MTNLQLYINDQLADLSDDSPIALTFQINNLAEVKNQQGNTSNQFKLPLTQRNRQILGFPDEVPFTSCAPYRQYPAKIVQDGLEIVPFGLGELNSIEQDFAHITILSGNVDFFDAIDDKLYDMGDQSTTIGANRAWKPFDHAWSLQNVVNSQQKTEGWIWPIVDYGKLPADFSGTPTIDVRYLRPGFFLKTAVDLIANLAGYTPTGSLLADPLYNSLIVQFANDSFAHGTDYQNSIDNLSANVSNGINQNYSSATVDGDHTGVVRFDYPAAGSYPLSGNSTYVAPQDMNVSINLNFGLRLSGRTRSGNGAGITIGMRLGNPDGSFTNPATLVFTLENEPISTGGGTGYLDFLNQKLSFDAELTKGQSIVIYYVLRDNSRTSGAIYAGATFTIKSKKEDVLYGEMVQCERIFPDMSQKDLLKDNLQRFGIICQTDNVNRTINFGSFRDIVNNIPIARDWSAKCLNQGKTISFQLGNYAQVNYLKYKTDDNVLPATLGQAQINIDDQTLPPTADLFQSQFAPTLNRPYIGGAIAQINKAAPEDSYNSYSINTQPRILIDQKLKLLNNGQSINFTDGQSTITNNDNISVPYFDKPGGQYSLLFDSLRLQYYPELEHILYRSKKVVRYLMLSPRDILELDLLIPVYLQQDGAYYYINKIDNWRKGAPTKVELVKLG